MSLLTQVQYEYNQLVNATNTLAELVLDASAVLAQCYSFDSPSVTDNSESPTFIDTVTHDGYTALAKSTAIYRTFTPYFNHSPKLPYRLPGVITLPSFMESDTTQLVTLCNFHKTKIKMLLVESGLELKDKRDLIQHVAPTAITLQIYRHIIALPSPIKRIGFTWVNKHSVRTFTYDEMMTYLKGSSINPPAGLTKNEWTPFVLKEIELLKQRNKDELIKLKRPLPTFPMANVSFENESKNIMRHAHMPLLSFANVPFNISPLKPHIQLDENNKEKYMIERLYAL